MTVNLTNIAVEKAKEILSQQTEPYEGLRIAVVGGGCSGFQYAMNFEKTAKADDKVLDVDGLKVFVDEQSLTYLNGTEVDFVEGLNGSGFKFNNPNVTGSCGCGSSFKV